MILPALDPTLAPASLAAAARALSAGGLIGLPTETVYGLGADADNASAVAAIFSAKGRPSDHPLIVHLAAFDGGMGGVAHYCAKVPPFAQQLMSAFWPGPLTLILPRRDGVGAAAAGGQNSIGLRCPSHPVAQSLLCALRKPADGLPVVWGIAAPSANKFGRVSPTTAAHVQSELGLELGSKEAQAAHAEAAPRAPGTLESHYAPNAKVRLMDAKALQKALDLLGSDLDKSASVQPSIAVYARTPLKSPAQKILMRRMPHDAGVTAQELFAVLRELDARQVKLIWVEAPPDGLAWDGVRDRLQRASASL